MRKFNEKYAIALQHVAAALREVVSLIEPNGDGPAFHDEVLCERLGDCWGKSIDEMAGDIDMVAVTMYRMSKIPQEYIDDINQWEEMKLR